MLLRAATAEGSVWLAATTESLAVRPHESADPTRPTAEITARAAHVPAADALDLDTALVHDLAAVLFAADACGTAARAVETAAERARTREQFGRPIGQFQGVKHLCADMLVRLDGRALTWDAARAGQDSRGSPAALTAALAAATALDTAYTCAKDCIQILGGTGFAWEHDAHLLLRRALVARQLLGTGDHHRLAAVRHAAAGVREASASTSRPRPTRTAARPARPSPPPLRLDPAAARRALAPPATRPRTSRSRTGSARPASSSAPSGGSWTRPGPSPDSASRPGSSPRLPRPRAPGSSEAERLGPTLGGATPSGARWALSPAPAGPRLPAHPRGTHRGRALARQRGRRCGPAPPRRAPARWRGRGSAWPTTSAWAARRW
ncbi:Crotonobetainyl-CoA reductase [Streptomyces tanashiensis]